MCPNCFLCMVIVTLNLWSQKPSVCHTDLNNWYCVDISSRLDITLAIWHQSSCEDPYEIDVQAYHHSFVEGSRRLLRHIRFSPVLPEVLMDPCSSGGYTRSKHLTKVGPFSSAASHRASSDTSVVSPSVSFPWCKLDPGTAPNLLITINHLNYLIGSSSWAGMESFICSAIPCPMWDKRIFVSLFP